MQTVQKDSKKMFTDEGIDISVYSDDVDFKVRASSPCCDLLVPQHLLRNGRGQVATCSI